MWNSFLDSCSLMSCNSCGRTTSPCCPRRWGTQGIQGTDSRQLLKQWAFSNVRVGTALTDNYIQLCLSILIVGRLPLFGYFVLSYSSCQPVGLNFALEAVLLHSVEVQINWILSVSKNSARTEHVFFWTHFQSAVKKTECLTSFTNHEQTRDLTL